MSVPALDEKGAVLRELGRVCDERDALEKRVAALRKAMILSIAVASRGGGVTAWDTLLDAISQDDKAARGRK